MIIAIVSGGYYLDAGSSKAVISIELPIFCMIYLWGMWFEYDRSRRHIQLPFIAGWLAIGLWPVAVLYYLLRTRGKRGFRALILLAGILLLAFIVGVLLSAVLSSLIRA